MTYSLVKILNEFPHSMNTLRERIIFDSM